jgi:hypothetical protein
MDLPPRVQEPRAAAAAENSGPEEAPGRLRPVPVREAAVALGVVPGLGNAIADARHNRFDRHGGTFRHQNFAQNASHGRRNLRIHFVRRYLKERFVPLDPVTRLLQPAGKGSLYDALPHLGHFHVNHRVSCNP